MGGDVLEDLVLDGGQGLAVSGWGLDCCGAWEVCYGFPAEVVEEVR